MDKKHLKKHKKKVQFNKTISTYMVESPYEYWRTFDIDMFLNNKISFETECKINLFQKKKKETIELPETIINLKMDFIEKGEFNDFEWIKIKINFSISPYCDLYENLKKYYWIIDNDEDVNKIRKNKLSRNVELILIFKNKEKKNYILLKELQIFIKNIKIKFEKINQLKNYIDSFDNKILLQRNNVLNQISNSYFEKLKSEKIQ